MKLSELVAQLTTRLIAGGDCVVLGEARESGALIPFGFGEVDVNLNCTERGVELTLKRVLTEVDRQEIQRILETLSRQEGMNNTWEPMKLVKMTHGATATKPPAKKPDPTGNF